MWGGFGAAPKFPQTFTIGYLLKYHHFSGNEEALQQAQLSLQKMIEGGLYTDIGGAVLAVVAIVLNKFFKGKPAPEPMVSARGMD